VQSGYIAKYIRNSRILYNDMYVLKYARLREDTHEALHTPIFGYAQNRRTEVESFCDIEGGVDIKFNTRVCKYD
jgi:hypothetical protein